MIEERTTIPTITPSGTYAQMIEAVLSRTGLEHGEAEKLVDTLLGTIGLCGAHKTPLIGDACTAMYFCHRGTDYGWFQCHKDPWHTRNADEAHESTCGAWTDEDASAVAPLRTG